MDLANFFDTISSMIVALYAFGYIDVFYWGTLWVIASSIGQLYCSYYNYLNNDAYRTTKFGFHSLFWQIQAWEQFMLTVVIGSENVEESREGMIGDLFCCIIALILVLPSLNMSFLELIHNVFFALLTISTIHQFSTEGYEDYFSFAFICFLYSLISLYATCASIVNSDEEKNLMIPTGDRFITKSQLQEILMSFKKLLIQFIQSNGFPETTISEIFNTLLYVCNGLTALSAIQGSLTLSAENFVRIPSVMTPGAVFQLYVCRIQAHRGRKFSPVLPFCYAATWATWTWLQFSGSLNDNGSNKGITLGTLVFLIINVFFIILETDVNIILVLLTLFMEILSLTFFLITLEKLPLPFDVTMLAVFCAISIYSTVASFTIFMFDTDFISLGLFGNEEPQKTQLSFSYQLNLTQPSIPESPGPQIIHHTRSMRTILKLFKDKGLCAVPIETLNVLIASSWQAGNLDYKNIQSKKPPTEYRPLLCKSQREFKSLPTEDPNQSNITLIHSVHPAENIRKIVKIFEN